jgi:hypothetical protein
MFTTLRKRLHLTPATAIAAFALVFAMTGGAYAAGKYVITSTKQISPKVLKSLQGKAGAAGKPGATGPAGPAGAAGAAGAGTPGATGKEGPAGKEGATGKEGAPGKNGETGFTATLPSKATETGSWIVQAPKETTGEAFGTPISFSIPLAASLSSSHVFFVEKGSTANETECAKGTLEHPKAAPGNLCVYSNNLAGVVPLASGPIANPTGTVGEPGASTAGALILLEVEGESSSFADGTWAVTAA